MRLVALAIAVGVCLTGTAAFAASLDVSSTRLTVWSAATGVPVSSCTLVASADTYVDSRTPDSSFGAALDLRIQSSALIADRRAFTLFDVASCVPDGARIKTGSLGLHLAVAPVAERTYEVHLAADAWLESLTWTAQPPVAAAASGSTTTGTTSGVTLSWDVAADIQAFADGTENHGWRVSDQAEGAIVAAESAFSSREAAANRPVLSITYYP